MKSTLGLLATAAILVSHTVGAETLGHTETVPVVTHSSQGEIRNIEDGTARIARHGDGVFTTFESVGLPPNHAVTLWMVVINAPENCAASPCTSADVMKSTASVRADLGFAAGGFTDKAGAVNLAAFQPMGELPNAWFGGGLTDPGAEIHLVLRDHGPVVEGRAAEMIGTFRDGCTDASVPDTLPNTARSDGSKGPNTCSNLQAAIFPPVQ